MPQARAYYQVARPGRCIPSQGLISGLAVTFSQGGFKSQRLERLLVQSSLGYRSQSPLQELLGYVLVYLGANHNSANDIVEESVYLIVRLHLRKGLIEVVVAVSDILVTHCEHFILQGNGYIMD